MEKLRKFLNRIRFVYRRSSMLLKCVVLAAILICTVTVITLSIARHAEEKKADALRKEAAALQQENDDLQKRIGLLGTVESVKQIAAEILGLTDPDSIIFETE